MKKVMLNALAAILMMFGLVGVAGLSPAYAVLCPDGVTTATKLEECEGFGGSNLSDDSLMETMTTIVNVIVGVVGFVAVVMIVIGGINFTISQGDSGKVSKAQKTILYGVVGLVVALLAFAIVNFVLGNIFS